MADVAFCRNCQSSLEAGGQFCGQCGAPIDPDITEVATNTSSPSESSIPTVPVHRRNVPQGQVTAASRQNSLKQRDRGYLLLTEPRPYGLGATPGVIWECAICLLGGLGSVVGLLTQSWLLAVGTVALATMLAYTLVYRMAMMRESIIAIAIISGAIAFGLAWYAST